MNCTAAYVAEALSVTLRAIQKRSKKESWPHAKDGKTKVFDLSDLPEDVRAAILAKTAAANITSAPVISAPITAKAAPSIPACLDDKRRYKALYKADLIRLYLDWQRKHGRSTYQKEAFITAYMAGAWSPILKELGPVSWKSIERWKVEQDRHKSALVLADKRGLAHRGKSLLTEKHLGIILGQILNPNAPRISQCARQIQKRCLAEGLFEPSDATIRRFVERYVSECFDEWTLFREGKKAWNDKCAISILRDWSLVGVGDVVIADGHVLNFETIHPETGKPKRMMLVLFYDGASAHPLGWEIMPTENVQCISSAFRRTCIVLGKFPKVVYLDNGKAFRAKFFKGCEDLGQAGISGLYESLGCQVIHAWPYHGQSKPIERFFGTMNDLEVFVPSYVGNSIEAKPARMKRGEDRHRALYAKMGGRPLTLMETHQVVARWFGEYASRTSRAVHLKGCTPDSLFQAGKGDGLSGEAIRRMDVLMMSQEIRTITKDGIRVNGRLYWHEALASRRHAVTVRYDEVFYPYSVLVYDQDGNMLCEAKDREHHRIAYGIHPAASVLGTAEQQLELSAALELKKRQEKDAAGNMTLLLNSTVLPEVQARQAAVDSKVTQMPYMTERLPEPKVILTPSEEAAFDAAMAKARAEKDKPAIVPPDKRKFRDEYHRYDYLFWLKYEQRTAISLPDAEFMAKFEASDDFKRLYKRRFDDLYAYYFKVNGPLTEQQEGGAL